jgi:DNA invertase Pin-like site-specific DNA recombinase
MSMSSPAASTSSPRFIAYYRVSTDKQGLQGLGMDAQRTAVAAFLQRLGADGATLLASYTEVESGKRSDRLELLKAMAHAKGAGAELLIAKLDRLSRDAHFLTGLRDQGIEFTACDMPDANRLTITILAAVAEHELKQTSDRTKKALAERRKTIAITGQKGHPHVKRLGNPNGARVLQGVGNAASLQTIKAQADEKAKALRYVIAGLRAGDAHSPGVVSAQGLARRLNELGYRTPRGGEWSATPVIRLLARLERAAA